MKKMILAAAALTTLLLTGCATGYASSDNTNTPVSKDYNNEDITERTIKLSDGRTIKCVVWSGYKKGGISCDWAASESY